MRSILLAPLVALAALAVTGCAALGGSDTTKAVLAHIELCDRHYTGAFGPTGANGSVDIACKAQTPPAPVAAPAAVTPTP